MRSSRFSALPYRFGPRTIATLAPPIGRVAIRAQQQRQMVVASRAGEAELDGHLREQRVLTEAGEVVPGCEDEPVRTRREVVAQVTHPSVAVADPLADHLHGAIDEALQADGDTHGTATAGGVQDVRRDGAQWSRSVSRSSLPRRIRLIFPSSDRTTRRSSARALPSRSRSIVSNSPPPLPVAQTR